MTDDRMDRAERIRNMREGNRGTDDQTDDADDASAEESGTSADDASAEESGTSADDASAEESRTSADDAGVSSLTTERDDRASTTGTTSTASETTAAGATTSTGTEQKTGDARSAASKAAEAAEPTAQATVDSTSTTDSTGTATASDAQAAAQRAAQAAADAMGANGDAGGEAGGDADTESETDTPAAPAGATGAGTIPGDITGVELPDRQLLEEAMATSSVESTEGGARAAMEGGSTQAEETVRVLEFSLGDEYYCLDIEYVEEIVKRDAVTRVPNTPDFVDGVVDLRGQITTILEPKEMMDIDSEGEQNLIIVFDPEQFEDQGAIGWVVDEVRQVVPVPESEINHPPVDAEYINGVVDRDEYEQFVIWVEPEDALAQATSADEE